MMDDYDDGGHVSCGQIDVFFLRGPFVSIELKFQMIEWSAPPPYGENFAASLKICCGVKNKMSAPIRF